MVMTREKGGGWLQAIMELVDHFHWPSWDVPANKDSRCCGTIKRTGHKAAFGLALVGHCVLSIMFNKSAEL